MDWRSLFIKILKQSFLDLKQKNHRCSLRMFAKKIGVAPGPLSELLQSKRRWKFSEQWAIKILNRLDLEVKDKNKVLLLMGYNLPLQPLEKVDPMGFLISEWYYFPIWMSLDLDPPKSSVSSIAKSLNLSLERVEFALEKMQKMNLVLIKSNGETLRNPLFLQSSNDITSIHIKKFHQTNLIKMLDILKNKPVEKRYFQSLTFSGNSEQMLNLKNEIQNFLQKVNMIMNQSEKKDYVYQLNIGLFPFED